MNRLGQRQRGATLIELAVAALIVTLLAVFTVSQLLGEQRKHKLKVTRLEMHHLAHALNQYRRGAQAGTGVHKTLPAGSSVSVLNTALGAHYVTANPWGKPYVLQANYKIGLVKTTVPGAVNPDGVRVVSQNQSTTLFVQSIESPHTVLSTEAREVRALVYGDKKHAPFLMPPD